MDKNIKNNKEINKENNKEIKSDYINLKDDTGNCYATDNAWLVVIKNIEKKLAEITQENLQQIIKQINDENTAGKSRIPDISLKELFKKIIEVAKNKWVESKTTNKTNIQIRDKILKKIENLVDNPHFTELSDLLDKTVKNENVDDLKPLQFNKQTQQITDNDLADNDLDIYKDIIKNLFVYTLPIMNSDSDLSNVFGRDFNGDKDKIDKIDTDFNKINNMVNLFGSTSVAGGSRSNKKTKKNSEKREKTHTKKNNYKKNNYNMRGGYANRENIFVILYQVILYRSYLAFKRILYTPFKFIIYKQIYKKTKKMIQKIKNKNIQKKLMEIHDKTANNLSMTMELYYKIKEMYDLIEMPDNYKDKMDKLYTLLYNMIESGLNNTIFRANFKNLLESINITKPIVCVYKQDKEKLIEEFQKEIQTILASIETQNKIDNKNVMDYTIPSAKKSEEKSEEHTYNLQIKKSIDGYANLNFKIKTLLISFYKNLKLEKDEEGYIEIDTGENGENGENGKGYLQILPKDNL